MVILEKLTEYLLNRGFKQDGTVFVREKTIKIPGRQIVINGQVMQEANQEMIRTVTVDFFGPGYIRGEDGTEEPFEEVRIKVEELMAGGKSGNIQEFTEGLYDEDYDRISGLITKLIQ